MREYDLDELLCLSEKMERIKLSQELGEGRTKIYGLDEPSKGLGRKEMLNLINIIYENIEKKEKPLLSQNMIRSF